VSACLRGVASSQGDTRAIWLTGHASRSGPRRPDASKGRASGLRQEGAFKFEFHRVDREPMELSDAPSWLVVIAVNLALVAGVLIYLLPFIVGETRRVPHVRGLFVTNLLLGWTLIGWVAAMAMACRSQAQSPRLPDRPVVDA
jgi:hypothetical protein